jgi:caffeoyl-CoA O-methyltransferase
MEFFPETINTYVEQHTEPENAILKKLNRETYAKIMMPRMLSGQLQGRVLAMLSQMIRPHRILEIGTFTGYSALCLAEGLSDEGRLYTIDINEELHDMVKKYVQEAELAHKIVSIVGDALTEIEKLNERFDLVFIDADKINYQAYYDMVFDKVRTGGFILADNVLWSGKVVEEGKKDADTLALMEFNRFVQEDKRVENVLFPIRDGIMVIRKK